MTNDKAPPRTVPGGVNPYLPTPVARVSDSGRRVVTVSTKAVRSAYAFLDPYLAGTAQPGRVMTIVGDFGTGKSHLAIALLRRAQQSASPPPDTVYLDAPNGSFADLYRRFVGHLNRMSLTELLRDYYAEIVADEVAGLAHTGRIVELLRSGDIDPVAVVHELHLPDNDLLRRQQDELIRITGDNDLGTALTLLLEPSTDAVVWDWLTGNPPHEFLQERGILRAIASDGPAVHALLAIARLYRERNRRFVVVIDEFDRVLSTVDRLESADRLEPFKHMLEQIGESGAFIVLVGMADMLQSVDRAVTERMRPVVRMEPMSAAEVGLFIRESHRRTRGDAELDPFRPEAVDEVAALSDGVPRRFIRLLHHLYRHAQQARVWITRDEVRRNGGASYDVASVADVRREVYQILSREGLRLTRGLQRDPAGEPVVDYWVADPAGDFRCAIMITGALLSDPDLQRVRQRLRRARQEVHEPVETVLAVVGYLTDEVTAKVTALGVQDPIQYGSESFAASLASVVTGILRRSDEAGRAEPLDAIRYQVDRIARQQTNLQDLVEQLTHRFAELGDLRREREREPAEVARGAPVDAGGSDPLLVAVEGLFGRALEMLATIERMDGSLAAAFDLSPGSGSGLSSGVRAVQARLQQQDGFSPLGTAVFLERLVKAFRRAFLSWYDAAGDSARIGPADREKLNRLCTNYETLYHDVPLDELKRLVESTARQPDAGGSVRPLDWPTIRLDDVRRAFAELAVQVAREVDTAFSA
ncbi:ATP-binding protein [Actinoplanes siamensis]|uniref:AAA+ ATPase domain-containing protein n=1 Tax=Actinoplanes siamensis TaxID=1223317 RepID=A0A919N6Q0_9ACTN|nr:ATP-binding protein [Actinoplanes siamensis]GIF05464.1 hypothetical protein Asi03nite_30020 [Actinoplanes siamensis]